MSGFDECSTTMSVIDEAYGPHCDLYRDVLGVHSNATPEQMQHAYFHRRNELFQLLNSMEQDEQDSITDSHRFHAERKLDAVVTAMRILGDPELRIQYDDMRHERMKKGSNLQRNNNNINPALRDFEDEPEMTRSTSTPKSALKNSNSTTNNRSVTSARSSARRSQPPPVPVSPTTPLPLTTTTTTTMEVDANGFPRFSPPPPQSERPSPHSKVKKKKKTKKRSHPPEPVVSSHTRFSSAAAAAADHYGSSSRRVKHFSAAAAAATASSSSLSNHNRAPPELERSSHGKRGEDHSGRRVRKNDRTNIDERGQDEEEDEDDDDDDDDEEYFEQDAFDDDDEEEEEDVISEETKEYEVKKRNTARELRKMEESARAAKEAKEAATKTSTTTTTTKHSSKLSRAVAVAKKKNKISPAESAAKATVHPSATTKSVDFMIPERNPSTEADVATDGNETLLDSATMDETNTLATDNLSVGEATSSYYLESPTEATDEGTILSDDWSEGADTLTVGQGTESVITRVRDEFWGAIEDTTVSVQQVLNVFTLQDEDIRAVTGQIKKARNQISRAF